MDSIVSTNPSLNYEVIGEVPCSTSKEIAQKAKHAKEAQKDWYAWGLKNRIEKLTELKSQFKNNHDDLAKLISTEMGMPIKQSMPLIDRALSYMDWNLQNAEKCLAPEITFENSKEINEIVREPYGVCASIAPWNFPATNFVWATFQQLIAGNTVLYKCSEETQLFSQKLEHMISETSLPRGVLSIIHGDAETAKTMLAQDIQMVSFTGSTSVGRKINEAVAHKLIPVTLELGGSDPAIVFEDADLDLVTEEIFNTRFRNCGQICCATKRLIVHESLLETVTEKLSNMLKNKTIGPALNERTDIGPLVSKKQLDTLIPQVEDARDKGANIIIGGKQPENLNGAYYEPTIITNVTKDMKVWHEEIFGPVLPIVAFREYSEAIELANDTEYGLGASVYTTNAKRAKRAALDINAGMVKTNQNIYNKPCNPFGGYKSSGLGRENGKIGFHDVTQAKIIAREK